MALDPKRLMRDAKRAQATRPGTAVGREVTGVTRAVRETFDAIIKLRGAGVTWAAIAQAMTEQGIVRSGGRPLTATRLTAIFGEVEAQMHRHARDQSLRAHRADLVSVADQHEEGRTSVARASSPPASEVLPQPCGPPCSSGARHSATEAEIRRAGLAELKRILKKE